MQHTRVKPAELEFKASYVQSFDTVSIDTVSILDTYRPIMDSFTTALY